MVSAIEGDQLNSQQQCASTCKHYFGYPDPKWVLYPKTSVIVLIEPSRSGKDRIDAWSGQRQMFEFFLPSFEATLPHSSSVMINSGSINEIPVHSSREILTDILRNRIGFTGVAVTDYQDIEKLVTDYHLVETYTEAALLAINAGVDMSMVPFDYSSTFTVLLLLVRSMRAVSTNQYLVYCNWKRISAYLEAIIFQIPKILCWILLVQLVIGMLHWN